MEKSTKMFLEVDASQLDVRNLLQKDFLELEMRAISSANPNRNNSWFTPESMDKALPTFVNKPVLGYFENEDFVSHNGSWAHDSETDMDYWNTLGSKGERILGIIRESDTRRVTKDEKGLSWITFTCALWTQYSFKQVKRLIKDAKRAQKRGGVAKNISVEVDITDYEILPNGVMKINDFNLVGVTILGSRNGVPVEPGIEDAGLSVVDVMGRDLYAKQEKSLRLAYEKLGDSEPDNNNKEDIPLDNEEKVLDFETPAEESPAQPEEECKLEEGECPEEAKPEEECKLEEGGEEVCPDCGKNPCECEAKPEEECKMAEDECPECEEARAEEACPEEECKCAEGEEAPEEECKNEAESIEEPEEEPEDECKNCKHEMEEAEEAASEATNESIDPKETEEYKALEAAYEASQSRVQELEHQLFMLNAAKFLETSGLDNEQIAVFAAKCSAGEIADLEALKTQVALHLFDHREAVEAPVEQATYSAPAVTPDTSAWQKANVAKPKTVDKWEKLHAYNAEK